MSKSATTTVSRRTVFASAGAIGALGAVAVATRLPGVAPAAQAAAEVQPLQPSGGYQLTDHVKQYYATARL